MQKYTGSCHCGVVAFEFSTDVNKIIQCNCSICQKKGALHLRIPSEQFNLISGKDALCLYQFETRTASHFFCKHCGIHPFSYPRIDPGMVSVNVRCLDMANIDEEFETVKFDGRNWEAAVKAKVKIIKQ